MTQLKDEKDYVSEDRQDLVARLMGAQALGNFLLRAFDALLNYGVNFKKLTEWTEAQAEWDEAAKLKPHRAQERIIHSILKLESGLRAAVRRKQFSLLNKPDVPPKD